MFVSRQEDEKRPDPRRELLCAAERREVGGWRRVENTYTDRTSYYETMRSNVRAEFLDSVDESRRCPLARFGGMGAGDTFNVTEVVVFDPRRTVHENQEIVAERLAALDSLKDNVVCDSCSSKLFWITDCKAEEVRPVSATKPARAQLRAELKGFSAEHDSLLQHAESLSLQVLLFAGDFSSRYRAATDVLREGAGTPELERALLNPSIPVEGTYAGGTRKSLGARMHTQLMPINQDQLDAIHSLKHRAEVIHGPPGTGKSTTIFHALSAHLPKNASAIVTCVCNQAVDAVAEKLCDVQDMQIKGALPMLVLGNPKRVGRTAAEYTLDEQVKTEELVVFMRLVCEILEKGVKGLRHLQAARVNVFLGGAKEPAKSRLSPVQIMQIPGLRARTLQRLLEEHNPDYILGKYRNLSEHELEVGWQAAQRIKPQLAGVSVQAEMVKLHLQVVRRGRKALASAAAKLLPVSARGRSVHGRTGVQSWNVGSHLSCEEARLAEAHRWLAFAMKQAPCRVVRRTRVFLCTIPSSYKVEQLKGDFGNDFPRRLFLAICDEAAATAETYVPQMMKLAVENLLLLGDHFQLQPLVLAKNHRESEQKQVSRSLMERMLNAGYNARMLKTQYRMFESLSAIVSSLFYRSKLVTAPEKLAHDAEEESGGGATQGRHFKKGASVEICWEDHVWYPAMVKRRHPKGGCYVDCEGEGLYIPDKWIRLPASRTAIFTDARKRLQWFDTAKESVFETRVGTSYVNTLEVAIIRDVLQTDPVLSSTRERVKVITLYKPQLQLLQKTCQDIVLKRPNVEFVTVDACQGTEAPHIVLSPVRSRRGNIGFASNPKRLNVAISRAIKSLSIVASSTALEGDKNWAKVYAGFKHMGEVSKANLQKLKSSSLVGWKNICREADDMAECQASRVPEPRGERERQDGFGGYWSGKGRKGKGGTRCGGKGFSDDGGFAGDSKGKGRSGKGYGRSAFGSKGCGGKAFGKGGKACGQGGKASGKGGKTSAKGKK
eukprot:TRINITY_DN18788_c0_g1_i1.p1 TRINITY_DN18788_c0_g1~~TRINITY_DN18788_c0_g1_i1.p1  ORF type:complete len:1003 (+),score=126.85 TRINITY_DN18788_c0_g1_i1:131-3139(+)